jgi:hypothetical protein
MIRPLLPGTGTSTQQVPDFIGAILAPGLIWTVPAEEHNLWMSREASRDTADPASTAGAIEVCGYGLGPDGPDSSSEVGGRG